MPGSATRITKKPGNKMLSCLSDRTASRPAGAARRMSRLALTAHPDRNLLLTTRPTMTKLVRWGILGTGRIAHDFATALRATPGAKLVAVASRSQASADAFGNEFDVPLRLPSYAHLAACDEVELVCIGRPHPQHAD